MGWFSKWSLVSIWVVVLHTRWWQRMFFQWNLVLPWGRPDWKSCTALVQDFCRWKLHIGGNPGEQCVNCFGWGNLWRNWEFGIPNKWNYSHIASNPFFSWEDKAYLSWLIHEKVTIENIFKLFVWSSNQLGDVFTKSIPRTQIVRCKIFLLSQVWLVSMHKLERKRERGVIFFFFMDYFPFI